MTKSTITDERITSAIERLEHFSSNLKWIDVRGDQDLLTAADGLRELQERRKAAMDSEPVVPEEIPGSVYEVIYQECGGFVDCDANAQTIWNACRAAMLQAEPVTTANKLPDDFDFDSFNNVTWLECVASNPHMHSPTTSTIARVALELNKRIGAGNSPVIPDGYVMVPIEPTMSQELAGYKTLNDTGRMSRLMKTRLSNIYRAMLAAAPQEVKSE